jgi:hypothetical protein
MLGVLGLALAVAVLYQWRSGTPPPVRPSASGASPRSPAVIPLPRIALDRLVPRAEGRAGKRNVFDFAPLPTPAPSTRTQVTTVETQAPVITTPPTPAPPPPLNVKYIGSVEKKGLRVAVFLTDRKEVLTGQEGDLLANRMKVVKIGFESVDVQDVGSDRTRRIPLRGN